MSHKDRPSEIKAEETSEPNSPEAIRPERPVERPEPAASKADFDKTLQEGLNKIGYRIPTSGDNTAATRTAIKDFKRRNGLEANRVWDDKAQAKLEEVQAKLNG